MKTYMVYLTTNLLNPIKAYVGMTNGSMKNYFGSDAELKNDIKTLGKENFVRTTLGTFTNKEECHYWEGFFVRTLKTHVSQGGYNKRWDGGVYNVDNLDERNKKIGLANKGKTKGRISPFKGKKHTEESRNKMKDARKDFVFSPIHRKHISEGVIRNKNKRANELK